MAKIKVVHTWRKSSRKKLGRWSACYCPIFDGVSTVRCRAGPHALNYQHMVAIVIEVNSYFLCEKICFVICFHTKVKRVTKAINSQYRTYNFSKSDGKVPKIGLSFYRIWKNITNTKAAITSRFGQNPSKISTWSLDVERPRSRDSMRSTVPKNSFWKTEEELVHSSSPNNFNQKEYRWIRVPSNMSWTHREGLKPRPLLKIRWQGQQRRFCYIFL